MRSLIPSLLFTTIGLLSFHSVHATNPIIEDCMADISAERDSICAGESIQLSATNDADIYEWSPANSIIGGTDQSPLVSPGITTTYTLTTTTLEDELIQNGDFEAGNTGFSSEYEVGTGGTFGLFEVWYIDLRDRLPTIAVPLRSPFGDTALDLQEAFDDMYRRAHYAESMDYTVDIPSPSLNISDQRWVDECLQNWA